MLTLLKITLKITAKKFSDKYFPIQVKGWDNCVQKFVLFSKILTKLPNNSIDNCPCTPLA